MKRLLQPCALLTFIVAVVAARPICAADAQVLGGVDTSRWRGFNLLEKFTLRGNAPYREDDFRWIAELGFNFVRLPMDYRCYTDAGDWLKFNEAALQQIDQAVAFGARYGVHVSLNLHRAPGFCINPPVEPKDLWTDPDAQAAFVAHWEMFARRYREIPPAQLSFNLLNEPIRNTRENYVAVHARALEAIHAIDPRRLVIVDGNNAGHDPAREFLRYENVVQATRGYHPSAISHYKASWVRGSDQWPEPTWPLTRLVGHLYGPSKPELRSPLVLRGNLPAGTEVALKLTLLSGSAKLRAQVDGRTVEEKIFDPKLQPDAWTPVKSEATWVYHQPKAPSQFVVRVPAASREIAIENIAGDWIQFTELRITLPGAAPRVTPADSSWGRKQTPHEIGPDGRLLAPTGAATNQPLLDFIRPWREIAATGETVFVGEWGCYSKTPHPVALAWMRAWLQEWQQARFGWALWNFRGSFGVLDSGRSDVPYEDWHGHKLDREMLRLLQEYSQGVR